MIRTDNFVKTLSDKGLVDDVITLTNGYDIQYKGNIVSVRLNGNGGALIYNQKKNGMVEVTSGRLDEVLHRYIMQSLFGTQTKRGMHDMDCDNVFFVPTKVIKNCVIFEDGCGRNYTVTDSTPQAILSFYKEACSVNADAVMVLLNGFTVYDSNVRDNAIKSSVESTEVEVQLLKCSVNIDDYAVSPRSSEINDVGQTVVGNFLCSSADKINQITFEEDEKNVFMYNSIAKRGITSSTIRTKNPLAVKAKAVIKSAADKKTVMNYVNEKYPNGLCLNAMEHVLAYETSAIFQNAKTIDYGKMLINKYLKNADSVAFRLDSNKSIVSAISEDGKSVAKFRAVPNISSMRDVLKKNGYLITELESGLDFNITDPAVAAIFSNCTDFVPVTEKVLNTPNSVKKIIGSDCQRILNDEYNIRDEKGVFNSFVRVIIN